MEPAEFFKGILEIEDDYGMLYPIDILEEEFGLKWETIEEQLESVTVIYCGQSFHIKDLMKVYRDSVQGRVVIFESPKDVVTGLL